MKEDKNIFVVGDASVDAAVRAIVNRKLTIDAFAIIRDTAMQEQKRMVEFVKNMKKIEIEDTPLIKISKSQRNNWSRRKKPIYRKSNTI